MQGEKITQLQDAMFTILDSLPEHDYFSIITFSFDVQVFHNFFALITNSPKFSGLDIS